MINYLTFHEDVLIPFWYGLGYLLTCNHDTHLSHLVDEASESLACLFGLLLILGIYLDCYREYFHAYSLIGGKGSTSGSSGEGIGRVSGGRRLPVIWRTIS